MSTSDDETSEVDQLSELSDSSEGVDSDERDRILPTELEDKSLGQEIEPQLAPPELKLELSQKRMAELYQRNEADDCLRETVKILSLTRIVHGEEAKFLLVQSHLDVAKVYWKLKKFSQQTVSHASQALQLLGNTAIKQEDSNSQQKSGSRSAHIDLVLQIHYYLAAGKLEMKKYEEADSDLKLAESAFRDRKSCGPMRNKNYWQAELLAIRSKLYFRLEKYQLAMESVEKRLSLLEKQFGPESPKLIDVYHEMAKIEKAKMDTADKGLSVDFCQKAYEIAKANFDDNNEKVGDSARLLSAAYAFFNSDESEIYVETYLNEAISCFQACLGERDRKTLRCRLALARLLAKEKPQEALTILKSCRSSFAAEYGELSGELVNVLKLMATVNLQLGNVLDAAKYLKQCTSLEAKVFGKSHERTENTAKALEVLSQSPSVALHGSSQLGSRPRFQSIHPVPGPIAGYKRVLPDY